MTRDLTPSTLTLRLAQLSRELDDATRDLVAAEEASVRAKHRAELADAKEWVKASGSVASRDREAFLATEQHHLDAEVAEARVKGCRARLATLRTQIDVGRSLLSSARAEMTNFAGAA